MINYTNIYRIGVKEKPSTWAAQSFFFDKTQSLHSTSIVYLFLGKNIFVKNHIQNFSAISAYVN